MQSGMGCPLTRSAFVRGAVDIEDRNGFGEFKETEPGTFGIVSVDKFSGSTTVH